MHLDLSPRPGYRVKMVSIEVNKLIMVSCNNAFFHVSEFIKMWRTNDIFKFYFNSIYKTWFIITFDALGGM